MKDLVRYLAVIVSFVSLSSPVLAAGDAAVETAFKKMDDKIIDLLRAEDSYLDSRDVQISYREEGGISFAVCCVTNKLAVVTNKKDPSFVKYLEVSVGNTNYQQYQQGIVHTTIRYRDVQWARLPSDCAYTASILAEKLFGDTAEVSSQDEESKYDAIYTFEVRKGEAVLATLTYSSVECTLRSISY